MTQNGVDVAENGALGRFRGRIPARREEWRRTVPESSDTDAAIAISLRFPCDVVAILITSAGARTHACMRIRACMHAHACMQACVHACMRACVRACVRACMRACVHACMHACVDDAYTSDVEV